MSEHPQDLTLRAQAQAVADGELDATELLEATLNRIEERDPALNSIIDRFASESSRMLAEAPNGPLHGVPIALKDMFALPWRAPRDGAHNNAVGLGAGESAVFGRLRDAGAAIVGVTNMHEFGIGSTGHTSIYGPCANPWDTSRCAGGSSGGSAAAVAGRLVAGAVGTDGGGSIRYPSAYCGVTGLKLTWGAVPADGYTHGYSSMSSTGPICREAADARLLGEVLRARPLDPHPAGTLRVGVPRAQLWGDLDPEVEQACTAAVNALRDAGIQTKEISLEGIEHALTATVLRLACETLPAINPQAMAEAEPHLSPVGRALTKYQQLVPAGALLRADWVRAQIRRSLASTFADVDVLAWPTAPAPAPLIENPSVELPSGSYPADYANVRLGGIANLAGVPVISIPCGLTADGLPVGLQVLAPWDEDARLLDVAELLESATDRRHVERLPPVAEQATA